MSPNPRHTGSTPLPEATYLPDADHKKEEENPSGHRDLAKNTAGRPPGCETSARPQGPAWPPAASWASPGSVLHVMPSQHQPGGGARSPASPASSGCRPFSPPVRCRCVTGVASCTPPGATLTCLGGRQPLCGWPLCPSVLSPFLVSVLRSGRFPSPPRLSLPLSQSFSHLPFSLCLSFLLRFLWVPYSFPFPVFLVLENNPLPLYSEPLPFSSEPLGRAFLLLVPAHSHAPPPHPTQPPRPSPTLPPPRSPPGLSVLLTDGRAVSAPSLKQHLIAVFCSWTSKLGLRRCAGVAVRGLWGRGGD